MNKKDVCATQIAYVRFTEDDLADLDNQVRRVGASSRGAYIRSLIKGVRPVELPPADYVALIDELAKLRRSIDTMAARAGRQQGVCAQPRRILYIIQPYGVDTSKDPACSITTTASLTGGYEP